VKINGIRADDLAGTGIITKERWAVPLWASLLGITLATVGRWLARGLTWSIRHPRLSVPALVLTVTWWRLDWLGVLAVVMCATSAGLVWAYRWPGSFSRQITQRARGWWRWISLYRRLWFGAMDGTGLTRTTTRRVVYVPRVRQVTSTRVVDSLDVRLLHGHTPEDITAASEGLRHVFGAYRCKVTETRPGHVRVVFYARDPLTTTVAPIDPETVPDLAALPVGMSEDGEPYRLRLLGRHILIVGASGAGKGSVLWSILRALAPAVEAGSVRVQGIDPKRMELVFAPEMFTRLEDRDLARVADMLEETVARMQARQDELAGVTREHTATPESPAVVTIIDELASLTAYCTNRDVRKRIEAALSLLLSQGRAVGFYVVAAVQDPRKDIVAFRDLFTVRIGLRVTESAHVDMVLGDGALDRGAACHRIPDHLPGIGYVLVEGVAEPVRVRFSYLSDPDIRDMATRWPAPRVYRPQAPAGAPIGGAA
jgi:S-DNA-T family DNA segregation ATPase FtsK/SpoIIIE